MSNPGNGPGFTAAVLKIGFNLGADFYTPQLIDNRPFIVHTDSRQAGNLQKLKVCRVMQGIAAAATPAIGNYGFRMEHD
jgi:hypothetical protein